MCAGDQQLRSADQGAVCAAAGARPLFRWVLWACRQLAGWELWVQTVLSCQSGGLASWREKHGVHPGRAPWLCSCSIEALAASGALICPPACLPTCRRCVGDALEGGPRQLHLQGPRAPRLGRPARLPGRGESELNSFVGSVLCRVASLLGEPAHLPGRCESGELAMRSVLFRAARLQQAQCLLLCLLT